MIDSSSQVNGRSGLLPRSLPFAFFLALFAANSTCVAGPQWALEADTVLTIPGKHGKGNGTCTLKKGAHVELRSAPDADPLMLSFAGVEFQMPRGESLRKALAELYPDDAVPDARTFDTDAWQRRQNLSPGEVRWLPLPPGPNDPRKVHWDPRGYFAIPSDPPFERTEEREPPPDFAWNRTFVIPGRFAFVHIPFILQKKPGICTGAAGINAVRHLRPEYQITTDEFFRLITDRPRSGSLQGLQNSLQQLGMVSEHVRPTRARLSSILQRLKSSFDRNVPVLAADSRHMVVLTGYNAETKKLFVWNQWGNGKIVNGMQKGHYELEERDLPIEFSTLIFPSRIRYEPADNVKSAIEGLAGASEDLQVHPYFEPDFAFRGYEERIGSERIRLALQAGRTVFVPQGDSLLCLLPGNLEKVTTVNLPGGARNSRTLSSLAQEILETSGGLFLSAKVADGLAVATGR